MKPLRTGTGDCRGCLHLKAPTMCACCGEPTAIVLRAGDCHLPLCLRDYGVLLSVRVAETAATKPRPKRQIKKTPLKRKTA